MPRKPRAIGLNHIALEVGDIDEALDFYGAIFDFELRSRSARMAFIDMGDQFIALSAGREQPADGGRHFGLVVDDKDAARAALEAAGADIVPGAGLDFRDPWGNRLQIVDYRDIQFTKAPSVLDGMGAGGLEKTEDAKAELHRKGLG
jgi:lactoylglutathione lyase